MFPIPIISTYGNMRSPNNILPNLAGNITQVNTVSGFGGQQSASLLQLDRRFLCSTGGVFYEVSSTGTLTQINTTRPGTTSVGQGAAMVGRNNELYFFGGGSSSASNIASKYNVSTNTWTTLNNYPTSAYNVQGTYDIDSDMIYLSHNKVFYSYNPNSGLYNSALAQPGIGPADRNSGIAGIAYSKGYIYMSFSGSFKRYNIKSNLWEVLQSPPVSYLACRVGVYNSVSGDVIYCLFGSSGQSGYWIYNADTNTFTRMSTTMPVPDNSQSLMSSSGYMIITSLSNIYKIT